MSDDAGLMMAMMQPPATMEEEFQDWYDTEHFPERRDCEGFVTAIERYSFQWVRRRTANPIESHRQNTLP